MTDAARKVLNGFARIPHGDQQELIEAMNRFLSGTPEERARLQQEYEEAVMGPIGVDCPCCGRARTRP